jgi:hypothetical protein
LILEVLLKEKTMNIIRFIKIQIELRRVERLTNVLKVLCDSQAHGQSQASRNNVALCLKTTSANLGLLIEPSTQVTTALEN